MWAASCGQRPRNLRLRVAKFRNASRTGEKCSAVILTADKMSALLSVCGIAKFLL